MHFVASKILQSGKTRHHRADVSECRCSPYCLSIDGLLIVEIRDRSPRRYPLLYGKPSAARRQADTTARCLDHIISSHLHDVGTPIELLRLVF
jgi:hypothetical protein